MATTTMGQRRRWQGPAILSYGFRPFFFFGSLWAGAAMVLWISVLSGALELSSRFDPVSWHAHAFLFGYLGAIIAGFLLTAVPNWTGRLPVVGWYLGGLAALWILGRIAVMFSAYSPAWLVAAIDLAFPVILAAVILREIVAGENWRNLVVLVLLGVFTLANLLFHLEAYWGAYPAEGIGLRLGLAAAIMMIGVIGGRIIPSFTRNWLVQRGETNLPAPPMQLFDKIALFFTLAVLTVWVLFPLAAATGWALIVMAGMHFARVFRWKGIRTTAELLVVILHFGYFFVPLGAFAVGSAILRPDLLAPAAAMHLWMAGAIGTMTLAVMTRATLGHTGRTLHANLPTAIIYMGIAGATIVRFMAGFWPAHTLFDIAGLLWCVAFFGFAAVYGPMLARKRGK